MPRAPNEKKREIRARVREEVAGPFVEQARRTELHVPKQFRLTCALTTAMRLYMERAASGRST